MIALLAKACDNPPPQRGLRDFSPRYEAKTRQPQKIFAKFPITTPNVSLQSEFIARCTFRGLHDPVCYRTPYSRVHSTITAPVMHLHCIAFKTSRF